MRTQGFSNAEKKCRAFMRQTSPYNYTGEYRLYNYIAFAGKTGRWFGRTVIRGCDPSKRGGGGY